jgi:hypothetical protein
LLHGGGRRAQTVRRDEIIGGDRLRARLGFLKFRECVAATAADDLERLGKPGVFVLYIDIGAATERKSSGKSAGKRSNNANVVGSKLHHGPPAALKPAQNAPVCVANMAARLF